MLKVLGNTTLALHLKKSQDVTKTHNGLLYINVKYPKNIEISTSISLEILIVMM